MRAAKKMVGAMTGVMILLLVTWLVFGSFLLATFVPVLVVLVMVVTLLSWLSLAMLVSVLFMSCPFIA